MRIQAGKETGVTLIELMIVLVISAVMTASIYATFISQQKSYATQTRVSDVQQNARAALTLMERDLRMTGAGVGSSVFTVQDFWGNNINQPITITDRNNDGFPEITVVYAAQQVSYVTNVNGTQVTLNNATGFGATNGTQYIAFETENNIYTIQGIVGNILTLNNTPPAHLATIANVDPVTQVAFTGAWAYLVKAITYQVNASIDPSTGQPRNTLERVSSDQMGTVPAPGPDDLAIANYITNLQVVWPFSGDSNLLQVTLTSQDTDTDGVTVRTREHQAVINIRN